VSPDQRPNLSSQIHPDPDPFTLFYYIRLVKRMFFDKPRTWILYEPMDRDKSLLLAMTSSFITSSFPYPSPLFDLTHQMALSSYL
jgi:NADH-ubiquinone oxidoreductase chain 2